MLELPMGLLYNYGLGPLANALRPTPLWAVLECSPPRAVIPASAPQAVQWGHNTWSDLHATPPTWDNAPRRVRTRDLSQGHQTGRDRLPLDHPCCQERRREERKKGRKEGRKKGWRNDISGMDYWPLRAVTPVEHLFSRAPVESEWAIFVVWLLRP